MHWTLLTGRWQWSYVHQTVKQPSPAGDHSKAHPFHKCSRTEWLCNLMTVAFEGAREDIIECSVKGTSMFNRIHL